jgi:4'-phosphopantetheinyl transferase
MSNRACGNRALVSDFIKTGIRGVKYQPPPAQWRPSSGDVHVCLVPLKISPAQLRRLQRFLKPDEHARATRFRTWELMSRFVASRAALRAVLSGSLGMHLVDVPLAYGSYGKPYIPGSAIGFNLSHSADCALIAIALDWEIGVDVERVRPIADRDDIARQHFCPEELADLLSLEAGLRDRGFFACWTRKEAYVKALGEGLNATLNSFRVPILVDHAPALSRYHDRRLFELHDVSPEVNVAAAVAVGGAPRSVSSWRFESAVDCVEYFRLQRENADRADL